MATEHAEKLIQQYQNLLSQKDIVILNINPNSDEDRVLALETALRGKTVDEYFSIVDGLFEEAYAETDKEKKNSLNDLARVIMGIGELKLGIDWS